MRNLLLAFVLGSISVTVAADRNPPLSPYSSDLKLVSVESETYKFEGRVTVRAVLLFEFDMASPELATDVNFARLIPDAQSQKLLPAVMAGKFAAPVRHVNLEPAEVALEAAFWKAKALELMHGSAPSVQMPVVVTLRNYTAEVVCDSRTYFATIETRDVQPSSRKPSPLVASAHGC
jgi:hypothetical protein